MSRHRLRAQRAKAYRVCTTAMECFFGSLKAELVHGTRYPTRDAARRDLFAYIEGYYNCQRLHSALCYITPDQAELRAA